jgi:putative nucleotidyltransferase with HDIG domain
MTPPFEPSALRPMIAGLLDEAQRSERSGARAVARQRYETALYLLREGEGVTASAIIRRIAGTYVDEGQFETAFDCFAAALAIAEALDDFDGVAHAWNWMAGTQLLRGNLDDADRLYATALGHATTARDERLQAIISQNLGIIASMHGNLGAALDHFGACLATWRAAGLREYLGPVLNNMGLVYTQLDRLDEAQAAYEEAVTHCDACGDVTHRLLALINSTALWLARGDIDRAALLCHTVLADAIEAGDQRSLSETYRHLGVIARLRGAYDDSERHLALAFEIATNREDSLLAAETAREQAELYERMGKNREMLQALSLSHRLFGKLRAQHNVADLERRIGRLERKFYDVVTNWAQTIESSDAYTHGHCERVADYACALARDVGYDEITMFWFRIGALLHDVGKIVVPPEILNKPGRFTDEEREVMERHAPAGSDLLRDIDFPWDILPMVRGHHERWDGRGYPDKLAGEDIELSARIVCVADVFDALTTDRPYRPAFTREQALTMMAADSGKLFDPELFARFERVMRTTIIRRHPVPHTLVAVAS